MTIRLVEPGGETPIRLIRRATKKAITLRASGRVKGSRNRSPKMSVTKPGIISSTPPTRISAVSASSPVGTLPAGERLVQRRPGPRSLVAHQPGAEHGLDRPGWRAVRQTRSAGRPGRAARPRGSAGRPASTTNRTSGQPRRSLTTVTARGGSGRGPRSCRRAVLDAPQVVRTSASTTIFWLILESPYSRSTKVIGTSTTR